MSARRHVDDLFTGAYDDDLSPIDEARFQAHIQSCPDCSAAYAEFTATVEALRELPKAHMARVVHLPSTAPIAEESRRPRINVGWLNAGLLRRFPATALAGAVAVALIAFALVHGSGSGTPTTVGGSTADIAPRPGPRPAMAGPETALSRPRARRRSPPSSDLHPRRASRSPSSRSHAIQSGDQLDLAASTLTATPGQAVTLYAQLSEALVLSRAARLRRQPPGGNPCRPTLRVHWCRRRCAVCSPGTYSPQYEVPVPEDANAAGFPAASASGPLVTFTVPGRPRPRDGHPRRGDHPRWICGCRQPSPDGDAHPHDALATRAPASPWPT